MPTNPTAGRPSNASSAATACAYRTQPVTAAPPPSAANGGAAPRLSETSAISGRASPTSTVTPY